MIILSKKKWSFKVKVAVITRHAVSNYGSILQTYATQQVIEMLGYDCEIIDYIRDDEIYTKHAKTMLKKTPKWNSSFLKRSIYVALRQPEISAAGKLFEKTRNKYLNLTKRYTNYEQLVEDTPDADVYMTGSDQVWRKVGVGVYDETYCLAFTEKKKIAYAASFGHLEFSKEVEDYYKEKLLKYSHIAMREDSGMEVLQNWGIGCSQVLDPTLLLGQTFWDDLVKPVKHSKYILIYQLHNNKKLEEVARIIAKHRKLKIIRVSAMFHQITRCGKFVWRPEMEEFLGYIKNAEYMITDSFHGTAFAINFNVNFIEILPNDNTGNRNLSILSLTGLTDRIYKDENDLSRLELPIDYKRVNEVIEKKRQESLSILSKMIEE